LSPAISIVALVVVAATCALGIFAKTYKDNWAQFVGMVLLCIWCVARVRRLLDVDHIDPQNLILHLGLMAYAVGTAFKQWRLSSAAAMPRFSAPARERVEP